MPQPPDKTPPPRSPAPQHNPVFVWPTPNQEDRLFWVEKNGDLPKNKVFEYGEHHPDSIGYPDHRLVFVSPQTPDSWSRWYYASKRLLEDRYNFEHTEADIGGNKFSMVVRTYIQLREEWAPEQHIQGEAMPDIPEGLFQTDFVLARAAQKRLGDETLDSLFIVKELAYVQRRAISQVVIDIQTGNSKRSVTNLFYRGEEVTPGFTIEALAADPNNAYWGLQANGTFRELEQISENWFAITESTAVPTGGPLGEDNPAKTRVFTRPTPIVGDLIFYETGVLPDPVPDYGTAHYDATNWPNHKLSFIRPADKTGLLYEFVYVADREDQDTYNVEFTQADIGGTNFNAIQRTYVTPRATFTPDTPAQGTTMATALTGAAGTYVLAERKQVRTNDQEIDNLYVIDVHTYVKKVPFTQVDQDEQLGGTLATVQTLYYFSEVVPGSGGLTAEAIFALPHNSFWGLQTDGTSREGKQLTAAWYAITTRDVVSPAFALSGRTYTTSQNYSWPAVLSGVSLSIWTRKDGGEDRFVFPDFSEEAYSGPCKAIVAQTFSKTAPTPGAPNVMMPLPIDITSPMFSLNLGPTLHAGAEIDLTTGTSHPVYEYGAATFTIYETSPTSWPSFITASDEVEPFRGGYLRTIVTVYPPSYTP